MVDQISLHPEILQCYHGLPAAKTQSLSLPPEKSNFSRLIYTAFHNGDIFTASGTDDIFFNRRAVVLYQFYGIAFIEVPDLVMGNFMKNTHLSFQQ
jgi:hypothetical protein